MDKQDQGPNSFRKLTIYIPLNPPEEFEGGDIVIRYTQLGRLTNLLFV